MWCREIDVVIAGTTPPGEHSLENGQQSLASDAIQEELFVFFLGHAHLVEHVVMVGDAELVEVLLHDEVLADVAALEPASKVVRHEPADHVAARRDQLATEEETHFEDSADRNVVCAQQREHRSAVGPLIGFNMPEGGLWAGSLSEPA